MSSTRGAVAANSRRVKQRLVQLLFGHKYRGNGREAHKKLDSAAYSYADLRSAYLNRIHELHPDKYAHKKVEKKNVVSQNKEKGGGEFFGGIHNEFVLLQEAWASYEEMAKMMKRVSRGDEMEANFTMFGVGCSFADSPEERELRGDIMNQAGRGWFTSGLLSEDSPGHDEARRGSGGKSGGSRVSLCDDDMFVSAEDGVKDNVTGKTEDETSLLNKSKRKSLVDHMFPGGKRP